jgi:hypothetical protein
MKRKTRNEDANKILFFIVLPSVAFFFFLFFSYAVEGVSFPSYFFFPAMPSLEDIEKVFTSYVKEYQGKTIHF